MKLFARTADHRNQNSWAAKFRQRRFGFLRQLLDSVATPAKILDVGGTAEFWQTQMGVDLNKWKITLFNIDLPDDRAAGFEYVQGDARDLSRYADKTFDVVVSNSVIEHVGMFNDQARMATEIKRVSDRYYIQTPNHYFPIEPHFLTPGFQFLPYWAKMWMVQHFRLGTYDIVKDKQLAHELVSEIRLLSYREFHKLFPTSKIKREIVCGLTKSFVAYEGWEIEP